MKTAKLVLILVSLLCSLITLESNAQQKKKTAKKPVKKTVVQKKPVEKTKAKTEKPVAAKTEKPQTPAPDVAQGEKKVRDIVAFLEYMLNMLGSSSTPTRDKDVLITESYSKIFRDTKVQIEDDLVEARNVITNKDIVPYLKDVDFFFTDVRFEFSIENIKEGNTGGQVFYKVSAKRNLTGTTADGERINKTIPRFIEINYDPTTQDLKIVSIYTNEFDERRALKSWWTELSFEWKSFFTKKFNLKDSVTLEEIKNITSLESVDISNNSYIQNLEPLAQLASLKSLNLSRANITDLSPVRNLTELTTLDLSGTKIEDLSALKYSSNLKRLSIKQTRVSDISVIQKMPGLQYLDASATRVTNFSALSFLPALIELNISNTQLQDLIVIKGLTELTSLDVSSTFISDLDPLSQLKNLTTLTIDSTSINNLGPLRSVEKLILLNANYTSVADLTPLQKLPNLKKIYCDKSRVTKETADVFMLTNKNVLVIYNSEDMQTWWRTLSPEWQEVLHSTTTISSTPTKEELARVTNLDSIYCEGNGRINDLEPVRNLHKLTYLNIANTAVTDLTPLQKHTEIRYLNINETLVSDIAAIRQLTKLTEFHADKTKIESIENLSGMLNLKKLYVDRTAIHDITALEFLEKNPDCLLIYKTIHLERWWRNLPASWKDVFHKLMAADTTTSRENLHKLAELKTLSFKDAPVTDLTVLTEFVQLRALHFSGTAITEIPAVENIKSLQSLHATNGPLKKIDVLSQLTALEDLDISNTPIDDLTVIGKLNKLKTLNCAGTQVKKLNALEGLSSLEYFDCSNTNVSNLDPVMYIPLKMLKCYNTKVSKREVDNFKNVNKGCEVVYYR